MADLIEAGRSRAALLWRSRVVELSPHSLDDRLALARTAMTFSDHANAVEALDGVDAAGRNTAAFHNVAGAVSLAINRPQQAETHFLQAIGLEPNNPFLQLNLSVVRLRGTNAQTLAEARNALQSISVNPTNSTLRCQALRELAVDAMRNNQTNATLALSQQLVQETGSGFKDRILRLDVLRITKDAGFKPALAGFQSEAATNPASLYELGSWQMANTSAAETLAWLRTLPLNIRSNQPAAMFMAECYAQVNDWNGLQAFLDEQNWGEMDCARHVFKARALRESRLTGAAKAEWEIALKSLNGQRSGAVMLKHLLQMVTTWGWRGEAEEILWITVNRYPAERWAFQTLSQILLVEGRTRPLLALYSQEFRRLPSNLAIKNNLAMTAILLEASELKPHDLAKEVYQKSPTNPAYASTYAYSLHLQENDSQALKIFQSLKPQDLQHPAIAGYYALVLKATGDKQKAKAYLDWADKGVLLPEEKKLFEQARVGI
jgi:tetratricopeptide (TPR) repeat protein